jgi:branched-chain amino acid aminotransferase
VDAFSNLKHTERHIYTAADEYARQNKFDEAIILNEHDKVADASIFNVFVIKDGIVYTPPAEDGPVKGVLRELLLTRLARHTIVEKSLTVQELYAADEIFLTNVIRGIRWVEYLDEKRLENKQTKELFADFCSIVAENFGEHLI